MPRCAGVVEKHRLTVQLRIGNHAWLPAVRSSPGDLVVVENMAVVGVVTGWKWDDEFQSPTIVSQKFPMPVRALGVFEILLGHVIHLLYPIESFEWARDGPTPRKTLARTVYPS